MIKVFIRDSGNKFQVFDFRYQRKKSIKNWSGSAEYLKSYVYLNWSCSCQDLLESGIFHFCSTELIILPFYPPVYLGINLFRVRSLSFMTPNFSYGSKKVLIS